MLNKNIEELTVKDIAELRNVIEKINSLGFSLPQVSQGTTTSQADPYAHLIGKPIFMRSVTMYYTGKLLAVYPNELLLTDAAWIPDTGRFHDALKTGEFSEVEPYVADKLVVGRGALLDICHWEHELPNKQK